jgi:hypothetical protein
MDDPRPYTLYQDSLTKFSEVILFFLFMRPCYANLIQAIEDLSVGCKFQIIKIVCGSEIDVSMYPDDETKQRNHDIKTVV